MLVIALRSALKFTLPATFHLLFSDSGLSQLWLLDTIQDSAFAEP